MNMPTQKARKKIRKNRSRQLRLSRSTPPLPRLLAAMARGGGKHAGWGRSSAPAPPRRQARTQWRAATSAAVPKYGPRAIACPTAAARPRVRGPPSSPRALARWCGAPWRAQRRPPGPRGEVTGRGRSYTGRGPPRAPAKAGPSPTRALAPPLPAPARRLPAAPRQRRRRRSSSPFLPRATAAASERSDETRASARTKRPNSRIEIPSKLETTRWRIGARAGERTPQRARWLGDAAGSDAHQNEAGNANACTARSRGGAQRRFATSPARASRGLVHLVSAGARGWHWQWRKGDRGSLRGRDATARRRRTLLCWRTVTGDPHIQLRRCVASPRPRGPRHRRTPQQWPPLRPASHPPRT